ncbi:hypothetical protein LUW75_16270 [Streptomyces sp. MRC013]|uniref:hypothetical protein n=1 Tax=Streptomyces sp. MRC013 TaxID=2898276 RepID=UPI002026B37B|nr:hypothetical protein [Streptomyces sp. MRC013]URM91277.1 hypothetical protein LUW75_16270 [Streptomyces sp. MRC013]
MRPASETEEAAGLARFLHELTEDLTLRDLEERFPAARKSLWGEYRKGAKDVPLELLAQVIRARVPVQRRERLLRQAEALCRKAEAARAGRGRLLPAPAPSAEAEAVQAYKELSAALRRQLQTEEALKRSNNLVHVLLLSIGSLRSRVEELTAERDALVQQRRDGRQLQRVLGERDEAHDRLLRYRAKLEQARRDRDQAEHLQMVAQQRAEEYQRKLERYERRDTGDHTGGGALDGARVSRLSPEVPLDEYEYTLERISEELDANAQELSLLRRDLDEAGRPGTDPRVVPGEVVDNADNDAPDRTGHGDRAPRGSDPSRSAGGGPPSGKADGVRRRTGEAAGPMRVGASALRSFRSAEAGARRSRPKRSARRAGPPWRKLVWHTGLGRAVGLTLGSVACLAGAHLAFDAYQENARYEGARPCAPGVRASAEHACIGRETGHVVGRTAGSPDQSPSLTVERASGRTEDHGVSDALYEVARPGAEAEFTIWRSGVVEIAVAGRSSRVHSAQSVLLLVWPSILIGYGVGLLLSSVLGSGAIRWIFAMEKILTSGFIAMGTFGALFFSLESSSWSVWLTSFAVWSGLVAFVAEGFKKEWEF